MSNRVRFTYPDDGETYEGTVFDYQTSADGNSMCMVACTDGAVRAVLQNRLREVPNDQ